MVGFPSAKKAAKVICKLVSRGFFQRKKRLPRSYANSSVVGFPSAKKTAKVICKLVSRGFSQRKKDCQGHMQTRQSWAFPTQKKDCQGHTQTRQSWVFPTQKKTAKVICKLVSQYHYIQFCACWLILKGALKVRACYLCS